MEPDKIEMEIRAWVASNGTLSSVKLCRDHAYLDQEVRKHLGCLEQAAKFFNLPIEKRKRTRGESGGGERTDCGTEKRVDKIHRQDAVAIRASRTGP